MRNEVLHAALAASGAAAWGAVPYAALLEDMSSAACERAETLCPGAKTVLAAAFPYFTGETAGNLSVYARGMDYHAVLLRRLTISCNILSTKYPSYTFLPGADNSPLPERQAAWKAGLGLRGKNGLLLLPPYGSYVFLGTILTNLALEPKLSTSTPADVCISCGKCLQACPSRALEGGVFHIERCLSGLTQKKGALSPQEAALLKRHPTVWGCDLCQTVCPYNSAPKTTPLPEFSEGYRASLTLAELDGLTNKTFRARFGRYAFAWRGPGPLKRNLKLKADQE